MLAITSLALCFRLLGQDAGTLLLWSYNTQAMVNCVAAGPDVDANGFPDVFAGTQDSMVFCFQGYGPGTGNVLWSYNSGGSILSMTTIQDVDDDGINDCVVGTADDSVYCLSGKPSAAHRVLWSRGVGGDVGVVKAFVDVNSDGKQDVLVGTVSRTIACLSATGATIWAGTIGGEVKCIDVTGDIDGDLIADCFVGGKDKSVYCFSGVGRNGAKSLLMGRSVSADVQSVVSIPSVDGDGKADCVIGTSGKTIECRQSYLTGNLLWSYTVQGSVDGVALVDDINEDGFPDVIAGSVDNSVYAIDGNDGTLVWSAPFADDILCVRGLADINQDSKTDIIIGTADDKIICISGGGAHAGQTLWSWQTVGDVKSLAVLPDVRGNAVPEVVAASNDNLVRVLEGNAQVLEVELTSFQAQQTADGVLLTWQTASETRNLGFEVQWSPDGRTFAALAFISGHGTTTISQNYQFLHRDIKAKAYYRLQQLDADGQIHFSPILAVAGSQPFGFSLNGNYPNPFNSGTFISYTLPEVGTVHITLFNNRGEIVSAWHPGAQAAGSYSVHWDGRLQDGRSAASGTYFYQVQWLEQYKTGTMVLMK
jgi:outer membrane protein assembly factor BamB